MTDRTEKLLNVRYVVSMEPHIILDSSKCETCEQKVCIYFCPAGCFKDENNEVKYNYEGCFECGTCRVMCTNEALKWDYPLGGYGVSFRIG